MRWTAHFVLSKRSSLLRPYSPHAIEALAIDASGSSMLKCSPCCLHISAILDHYPRLCSLLSGPTGPCAIATASLLSNLEAELLTSPLLTRQPCSSNPTSRSRRTRCSNPTSSSRIRAQHPLEHLVAAQNIIRTAGGSAIVLSRKEVGFAKGVVAVWAGEGEEGEMKAGGEVAVGPELHGWRHTHWTRGEGLVTMIWYADGVGVKARGGLGRSASGSSTRATLPRMAKSRCT